MLSRIVSCTMVAAAVALFTFSGVAHAAGAAKSAKPAKIAKAAPTSHSGKVVSVAEGKDGKDGKLVMSDADGKNEHTHAVLTSTKITLNKKDNVVELENWSTEPVRLNQVKIQK